MAPLEQETNLEVVRAYAILMRDQLKSLSLEVARLKDERLEDRSQFLSDSFQDQLHRLQTKFYGFGREELSRKSKSPARPVGHSQAELKLHNQHRHDEQSDGVTDAESVGRARLAEARVAARIAHDFSLKKLEEENEVRGITVIDRNRPDTAWKKLEGLTQDSVEITITERVYTKVVHSQAKYRLKDEYNTSGKEVIITAPGPAKLAAGCQYSIDFAIAVVTDKYEYHLPLERQRRKMESGGLDVDVRTLYGLCEKVAAHCEESVIPKIRQDILADFTCAHVDETPWGLTHSKTRGQMWCVSNRVGSYYRFEPTRSGKVAEEMLEGFEGSALVDGFSGYNRIKKLPGVRVGQCWAHVRREFFERFEDFPGECEAALELIDELFSIEGEAKSFEALAMLRRTRSRSITEQLKNLLWEIKGAHFGSSGVVKAVDYTLNHWAELTLFLQDLSLPLDNNQAERALRHAVMGRKNFGGSKTIDGADVAATLYTVIETAKKNGIDPKEYLRHVVTERWHGRDPQSPLEYSCVKLPRSTKVIFPPKGQWRIEA